MISPWRQFLMKARPCRHLDCGVDTFRLYFTELGFDLGVSLLSWWMMGTFFFAVLVSGSSTIFYF